MIEAEKKAYAYLIMLLSPVLGVVLAVRHLSWKHRKSILIFATTLFGASIVLGTSDGYILKQLVYDHYVGLSFHQWWYELEQIILFSPEPPTKGDVFSHVSSYLIGEILGLPGIYFIFVSFIFGYFFINGLSKILDRECRVPKTYLYWLLIIIFITYRFVDTMQSIRTPIGLWVLFNGVYGYHQTKKSKYIWLMLMAPLFHFAFFIIALPAFVVIFIKRLSPKILIGLYIVSFFISVSPNLILPRLQTTDLGEAKVESYYSEEDPVKTDKKSPSANFYKTYGKAWALNAAPQFLAWTLILGGLFREQKMNNVEIGMFSTAILMATMANLLSLIHALYNRTTIVAGLFIIAVTVLLLLRGELGRAKKWNRFFRKIMLWISVAVFTPYLLYVLADMFVFTSAWMLCLSPLGFFEATNMSIRQLIGVVMKFL